ncbi:MAG: DNA polymerase III subunit delta [Bacteroidetes bacterium]|nr:DNA polymerase III subunit delta [Bacteroidota bacterium]
MVKEKSEEVTVKVLQSSILQKNIKPLYYFFGEEDYLIEEIVKLLIEKNIDKTVKGFNLDMIDGGSVNVKDVVAYASAYPMMSEKRVLVVRDFNKLLTSENSKEIMLRYLQNPSHTTVLIMTGTKLDNRTTIAKAIRENGTVVEFKPLYDNQVHAWIRSHVKIFGKNITEEAAQLLAEYVGNSMREIHNELEKLSIYLGSKLTIEEDDVNAVVGVSKAYNVFALQNAIGQRDVSKAVTILENMMENGENSIGTIVMLTKYFQKLWIIKGSAPRSEVEIANLFNINKFFVKNFSTAASNYKLAEIENAFNILINTDETLKTSGMDEKLAMTLMIYNIMREGN